MILLPEVPDPEYLKRHVDSGLLRAAANVFSGPYSGMAFATAPTVSSLMTTTRDVCPGDPGCIGAVLDKVHKVQSGGKPGDVNAFATVTLQPGAIREFQALVRNLPDPPPDLFQAVTLTLAAPGFHAVVEVAGDSVAEVNARLLEILDVRQVVSFQTHLVQREQAFGWGNRDAELD